MDRREYEKPLPKKGVPSQKKKYEKTLAKKKRSTKPPTQTLTGQNQSMHHQKFLIAKAKKSYRWLQL
jgi:hypothetical protein